MKKTDYKTKNTAELVHDLADTRHKLHLFRFGVAGSKSKNVKEGRTLRKNIARIETALKNVKA